MCVLVVFWLMWDMVWVCYFVRCWVSEVFFGWLVFFIVRRFMLLMLLWFFWFWVMVVCGNIIFLIVSLWLLRSCWLSSFGDWLVGDGVWRDGWLCVLWCYVFVLLMVWFSVFVIWLINICLVRKFGWLGSIVWLVSVNIIF